MLNLCQFVTKQISLGAASPELLPVYHPAIEDDAVHTSSDATSPEPVPAVAEEEPDDTTSSESLRPRKIAPTIIGVRVSVSSIACIPAMHTTCNYSYTFIMLVDIIIIGVGMARMPAAHNTFSKPPN